MKALLFATALLAAPALAQDARQGEVIYGHYCATCHGIDARGNGPMAPSLVLQPPDLSSLTTRNNSVFPLERVVTRIDGRDPLTSHGSPMPVWGPFFDEVQNVALKTEGGQPMMMSQPIADLVVYLQHLQD